MFDRLETPEFNDFLRPNSELSIEANRIILEILGSIKQAEEECMNGEFISRRIVMGGKKAFLLRYKDKKGQYRPVSYMSYDEDSEGNIHISEIQGTKERRVAYRFYATFDVFEFFLKLIEDNFTKQGKKVTIDTTPEGYEDIGKNSLAPERYIEFHKKLQILNSQIKP